MMAEAKRLHNQPSMKITTEREQMQTDNLDKSNQTAETLGFF